MKRPCEMQLSRGTSTTCISLAAILIGLVVQGESFSNFIALSRHHPLLLFSNNNAASALLSTSSVCLLKNKKVGHNMPRQQHHLTPFFRSRKYSARLASSSVATTEDADPSSITTSAHGNQRIEYSMASIDLSAKWLELVQKDQVAVTTTIPSIDDSDHQDVGVRYGVRVNPHVSTTETTAFMEFVEPAEKDTPEEDVHPKIARMNHTLRQIAGDANTKEANSQQSDTTTTGLQFQTDGTYVAQLQLVRTLRPPPSPGFGTAAEERSSSKPPPYNPETDSFVTGPLRLELRPLVARIAAKQPQTSQSLTTDWDIFHNISPADVRGHFLLIPTLQDPDNNWRGQALAESDCHDLVMLTSTVKPIGSLMVCFNSVGAGASQNHIHCHVWPSPPVPLLSLASSQSQEQQSISLADSTVVEEAVREADEKEIQGDTYSHDHDHDHSHDSYLDDESTRNGWSCYAVSRVASIYDFLDICDKTTGQPLVEASFLEYPSFCVQLSSSVADTATSKEASSSLEALGKAVWKVLSCLEDAPHNVCMVNRPANENENDDDDDGDESTIKKADNKKKDLGGLRSHSSNVDVYIFARSRERSPTIVPASKLGASEMMGVFHCQSSEQLEELMGTTTTVSPMAQALEDVSHEEPAGLWETIKNALADLET